MKEYDLKERTKRFALQIIKVVQGCPKDEQQIFLVDNYYEQERR